MSEHGSKLDAATDDDPRRQLWIRAGVAGGLIAVLLGGLALFDHLSRPPQPEEVAVPTKPIAPAQINADSGRDAPPEVVRAGEAASGDDPPAASPEGSAPPTLPEPDVAPAGPPAEGTRAPARPAPSGAAHVDASARSGGREEPAVKPGSATPARPLAPAAQPRPVEVAVQSAATPTPAARPAAVPVSPPVAGGAVAPVAVQKPTPVAGTESAQAYVLQFGFFSSVASAEALKARLAQAGVPSQIETRLIVGPFADRREALAAQARLREKGVDSGVLLPLGR